MNLSRKSGQNQTVRQGAPAAFTLIELLVVIAIIGMLAGMVVHLAGNAAEKSKRQRMIGEMAKLTTAIENYKSKYGFYPPDNDALVNPINGVDYETASTRNPLLFELTGPQVDVNASGQVVNYQLFNGANVTPTDYEAVFHRKAVANAFPPTAADQKSVVFLNPVPEPVFVKAYSENKNVLGLVVAVPLTRDPADPTRQLPSSFVNFWHYDASSTNRHNLDTYDLWAVYSIGNKIETNANWMHQ